MTDIKNIFSRIDSLESDAIDLMKSIVAINAIGPKNDGPGETEKAAFLIDYLKNHGFENVENYPAPDPEVEGGTRPNIVATLPGKDTTKTVWIMAHTDVVPEGDRSKWDTDPFTAVVKDGKIFGRGTEDNHQGLVSGITAARAFIEEGATPACNIGLVLVADEETGSDFGLMWLLNNHSELFQKTDLIIIPDAGEPDASMIEIAEKSIIWFKIKTIGKQVHASTPDRGINAFRAASHFVVELEKLHDIYNATDPIFDPPISTFTPTKKEANVPNVNTLPGDDIFYLDCRIMPQYDIADVRDTVRKMADDIEKRFEVKIELSTEQEEQAAPATDIESEIVHLLKSGISEVYGIEAKPQGIGGGTVAAIFRRAGYPAAVWSTLDDMAHQPNEYCRIANLLKDAKVFAHCIVNSANR